MRESRKLEREKPLGHWKICKTTTRDKSWGICKWTAKDVAAIGWQIWNMRAPYYSFTSHCLLSPAVNTSRGVAEIGIISPPKYRRCFGWYKRRGVPMLGWTFAFKHLLRHSCWHPILCWWEQSTQRAYSTSRTPFFKVSSSSSHSHTRRCHLYDSRAVRIGSEPESAIEFSRSCRPGQNAPELYNYSKNTTVLLWASSVLYLPMNQPRKSPLHHQQPEQRPAYLRGKHVEITSDGQS